MSAGAAMGGGFCGMVFASLWNYANLYVEGFFPQSSAHEVSRLDSETMPAVTVVYASLAVGKMLVVACAQSAAIVGGRRTRRLKMTLW